MLTGFFALCLLVTLFAPGSFLGRAILSRVVEPLARSLCRLHKGHLAFAVSLGLFAFALLWLLEFEGVHLLAFFGPEMLAWATTFEIPMMLDALISVSAAAAAARFRPGVSHFRAKVGVLARRLRRSAGRQVRSKRVSRQKKPANDDGDHPAILVLAA